MNKRAIFYSQPCIFLLLLTLETTCWMTIISTVSFPIIVAQVLTASIITVIITPILARKLHDKMHKVSL